MALGPGSQVIGSTTYVLGARLFQGGEGGIYAVQGRADVYAKLFDKPVGKAKFDKLSALVQKRSPALERVAAWPLELLADSNLVVVGILIPVIVGGRPLHAVFSPKDRLTHTPTASQVTLTATAAHLASAVADFHDAGLVVGDLSAANVLMVNDGSVRIIDCDSVQVGNYPCDVGLPEMLAPELQGQTLSQTLRKPTADIFTLAILIHQILGLGRNPFAGNGDMQLPVAIKQGLHTLRKGGNNAFQAVGLTPGEIMSSAIINMLAKSFEASLPASRPSAREWAKALRTFESSLVACSMNTTHAYPAQRAGCPWCRLEVAGKKSFFYPTVRAAPVYARPVSTYTSTPTRAATLTYSIPVQHRPLSWNLPQVRLPLPSGRQWLGIAAAGFCYVVAMQPNEPRSHYTPSPTADVVDESEPSKRTKSKRASKAQDAQSKVAKSKRVTEPEDAWKTAVKVPIETGRRQSREPARETGATPWGNSGVRSAPSASTQPVFAKPIPTEPPRDRRSPRDAAPLPWGNTAGAFDPSRYQQPVIVKPGPPEPPRYRQPPRRDCRDLIDIVDGCFLKRFIR
jgi:serine/threonine protein kinase